MSAVNDWENLSAYVDNALEPKARAALEARLATDAELRAELQSLENTVQLVRSLPHLTAPRNFTLDAKDIRLQESRRPTRVLRPTFQNYSNLIGMAAALLLVLAGVFTLLTSGDIDQEVSETSENQAIVSDGNIAQEERSMADESIEAEGPNMAAASGNADGIDDNNIPAPQGFTTSIAETDIFFAVTTELPTEEIPLDAAMNESDLLTPMVAMAPPESSPIPNPSVFNAAQADEESTTETVLPEDASRSFPADSQADTEDFVDGEAGTTDEDDSFSDMGSDGITFETNAVGVTVGGTDGQAGGPMPPMVAPTQTILSTEAPQVAQANETTATPFLEDTKAVGDSETPTLSEKVSVNLNDVEATETPSPLGWILVGLGVLLGIGVGVRVWRRR